MTDVRKLDLNLLVVLDSLLVERNLTRASEHLGMTQPALSAALTKLRVLLDDRLLDRQGREFLLTPRARALIPIVADCISEVQRTFEVLPAFDPKTSTRTFLVSASDYALSELMSPLHALLANNAPSTRVQFDALPTNAFVSPVDLLRRDLTITATGRGVPGKTASLFSDRFVCVVDKTNPRLLGDRFDLDALADTAQVRSVFGSHASTHIDDMLGDAGINPRVVMTVQGFLPVPFAVAGTPWVGWVPERTAQRYADSLGLVIVRTPIAPRVLVEAAHWHPSKTSDPALQWLVGQMRHAAEIIEFGDEA